MYTQLSLNAKLQPMHRHELEDVLLEIFEKENIEAEITGGGTAQGDNGEITCSDLEIAMNEFSEETVHKIITILEKILAPVGSKATIFYEDENKAPKTIPFGKHEGLGIYLSNELEAHVYQENDVNVVYQEIQNILEENELGRIESYWEGQETALYLYGGSFEKMKMGIQEFLNSYPLCEKCRIEQIA